MENYFNSALIKKKNKIIFEKLKFSKLQKGQVLVKIIYSSLCRSQLMEFLGKRKNTKYMPHLFGHEAVGKVIDKNKLVKKVNLNDKVILSWIKSSGLQSKKPQYKSVKNKFVNSGILTTFSEYVICSENNLIKKPKDLPDKFASLFGCAFLTGGGMAYSFLNSRKDKNIIIYGLGGVGVAILLYLKSINNINVIVIDNDKKKIKFSKKLGFKNSFLSSNFKNLEKKIISIYKEKADICFETCGQTFTIEESINLIKNNGKVVFCSHPETGKKIKIDPHELIKGKKIYGTWGGNLNPDLFFKKVYFKIKKNLKYLDMLNNKVYNLKEINKAFNEFKNGKVFRPIIKLSK